MKGIAEEVNKPKRKHTNRGVRRKGERDKQFREKYSRQKLDGTDWEGEQTNKNKPTPQTAPRAIKLKILKRKKKHDRTKQTR